MEISKKVLVGGAVVIALVSGWIGAKINDYNMERSVAIQTQALLKANEEQEKADRAERDRFFAIPDRKGDKQ